MTTIQSRRFATAAELDAALIERLERAISGPAAARTALMLAGGRTPLPAYRELARRSPHPAAGLHLLFSDDRYVPATSASSNYFQSRPLLDALALPEGGVLRVRTELPLEQAADDYEQQLGRMLRSGVRIGVGLLGLGADGHTASLFDSRHLEQARGRLAIAVQRPDAMQAVSVTPDLLSQVAEPLFLVAGPDKHAIVEAFLRSDSTLTARRAIAGCPQAEIWIAP
ncbi:MAG TPA: 6-phosphogluconolactonase [Steroidobacteraceae bacterium]|nr:6-phosphogluconolactonase [Steroidobacteraceae bacterium]